MLDLLLIAGTINNIFYSETAYKKNIINKQTIVISQLMNIIEEKHINFNAIIILDEGIDQTLEEVEKVIQQVRILYPDQLIIFITRNLELKQRFKDIEIHFQENIRISSQLYNGIFKYILETKERVNKNVVIDKDNINLLHFTEEKNIESIFKKERISLFSKFKSGLSTLS